MTGLYDKIAKTLTVMAVVAVCGVAFGYPQAFASKGDLKSVSDVAQNVKAPMNLTLGKADIISLPAGVSDVLVANPAVVDVQAVQSNKLYAVGLSIGDTNIIVLDAKGDVLKRIDIHVTYDLQAIQAMMNSMFPDESITVDIVHSQFYLMGKVSTPEVASRAGNILAHYVSDLQEESDKTIDQLVSNLLEVRGEQQVMLQVKIVEAERSIIKELGVNLSANDANELSATQLFGNSPPSSFANGTDALQFGAGAGLALSQSAVGVGRAFFDSGIDGVGTLGLFLNALEEENLINVLAEPNLTAVSGQQAGFLAGGEFPVPTGRDNVGNITIEFREFGVSLNFKPVVLSEKRISLQMETEVSTLDATNAVTLAGLTVPGLDIRRADTTVEIPSGGSLMIAGILQSKTAEGFAGLPGISKTPVLGDLISSKKFKREETELVVIVTAYMVEPYADKAKSDHTPKENRSVLAKIFATNIRRAFDVEDENVFAGSYGYIVD
ncbi:MAG: type II and III secretion system protein family protein [Alphaproteobacteria bacterium]